MAKAVTIIRCHVGMCHTPTQCTCMSCGKPVCYEHSTEELADMYLQTSGLFCDDCWAVAFILENDNKLRYILQTEEAARILLAEYDTLHLCSIRDRVLEDVPLVKQGVMSCEQCISYAQYYLEYTDVTPEQARDFITLLQKTLKCEGGL